MEFLNKFYLITLSLLPFVAIILLIVLVIFVVKLFKTLTKVNSLLDDVDVTVNKVNGTIDELQKPVGVVVKVSGGIDQAYDSAESFIKNTGTYIMSALGGISGIFEKAFNRDKNNEGGLK
ncbi:MAG: hypothetical protein ACK5G7_06850 [Erysipelotrichaceae bacterium]